MLRRAWSGVLAGATLALMACGPEVTPPSAKQVTFEITRVTPGSVFIEGGEAVTLETREGCDAPSVRIAGIPVDVVEKVGDNRYTILTPPAPDRTITAAKIEPLEATCETHPDAPGTIYRDGGKVATEHITYDPALEPHPTIASSAPTGDRVSVTTRITIVFSRPMNWESILLQGNITVDGVAGTLSCADFSDAQKACRTVVFTPTSYLEFDRTYTVRVKGGENGVRSFLQNKTLRTTLTPRGVVDPTEDVWEFRTRRRGENDPWVGSVSSTGGFSQSSCASGDTNCKRYKLFSITGQPAPVGVAVTDDGSFRMQSGFVFRSQTGTGD